MGKQNRKNVLEITNKKDKKGHNKEKGEQEKLTIKTDEDKDEAR